MPSGEQQSTSLVMTSRHVFRYFDRLDHAEAMLSGDIFVSTLEYCRNCEGVRADSGEAEQSYSQGLIEGGGANADVVEAGRRLGVHIENSPNARIKFRNNRARSRLPDAFVLCTSLIDDPEAMKGFGPYCVAIREPALFMDYVTRVIRSQIALLRAECDHILYRRRSYRDLEPEPGRLGFVKPVDPYEREREYRFLWVPEVGPRISRQTFRVEAIRDLVRRVR